MVVAAALDYIRRACILYELGCLIRVTPSLERAPFEPGPAGVGTSRKRSGKGRKAGSQQGRGSSTFRWALAGGLLTTSTEPFTARHSRVWPTQARNEGLWRRPLLGAPAQSAARTPLVPSSAATHAFPAG